MQTYASGPRSEVNSLIWPNPEFDNDITVHGPEVKSLVQRYLAQMIGELGAQPDPDDPGRTLLESIDAVRDGVITRPTRVFAPGFGAGAVGGYAVMRIDPTFVADEVVLDVLEDASSGSAAPSRVTGTTTDDMRVAFGE